MANTKTAGDDSEQNYRASVAEIAKECFNEAVADAGPDKDRIRDEAFDRVHEAVDGSYWIIYTHAALKVLQYSRNDDAIFEEGDGLHGANSMSDVYTQAAFWAMRADVVSELEDLIDNYEEPEEEEEEEEG